MSYLVTSTRVASLQIGGVDYTSNLLDWTVSDASANKNGCIQTSGTIRLGLIAGTNLVEDYDRNKFRRGTDHLQSKAPR